MRMNIKLKSYQLTISIYDLKMRLQNADLNCFGKPGCV